MLKNMVLAWLNTLRSYLCGGNAVNKADLLETFFTQSQAHFPPGIDFLMDNFKCISSFIDLILQIEIHVAAESFHLQTDESRQVVENSSCKYLIHNSPAKRVQKSILHVLPGCVWWQEWPQQNLTG